MGVHFLIYMYISWCISNIQCPHFRGGIRGIRGFLLYTLEDPGVIKARPHIMYVNFQCTFNIAYLEKLQALWNAALSSPVLVLDGGGVCSSRADELATIITD